MEATQPLITKHLQIPADAWPHSSIQAAAEIPFSVLETLAEELGADKIPVRTLARIGWHYTKAEEIIARARQRGLSDWRYGGFDTEAVITDFRNTYG